MVKVFVSNIISPESTHEAVRRLLNNAIYSTYKIDPATLIYAKTPSGKPYFSNCGTIKFNLSHSGEYAAAAISDTPVGVDIERIRPIKSGITERYLRDILQDDTDIAVIEAWCKRESYGKFIGEGFLKADFSKPHYIEILHEIPEYIIAVCTGEKAEIEFMKI